MDINRILLLIFLSCILNAEPVPSTTISDHNITYDLNRIGDYGYPDNPLYDRAKGYLLKGKAKTAVTNYGNFISWDYHPGGLWGEYGYLPNLSFAVGVPGHEYSSAWSSLGYSSWLQGSNNNSLWFSTDAYNAWMEGVNDPVNDIGNYKTIVYNTVVDIGNGERGHNDRGDIAEQKNSLSEIDYQGGTQWFLDHGLGRLYLFLDDTSLNPNYASSGVGLAFPWSIRPKFKSRAEINAGVQLDLYEYGDDQEEWTEDDDYVYYGANTAESWLTRDNGAQLSDWQPTTNSRYNSHNLDVFAGELFGTTGFTDSADPNPVLAHSNFTSTWPEKYNMETGDYEKFWPGWWADEYYGENPGSWAELGITDCDADRLDDDCWKPVRGRHISDMDVYMEFDDRWAHLGNQVINNKYEQTGYPMGLKVKSMAHSYGISYAEDVMFVTVKVRNESGDFCAFEKDKNGLAIPVFDNDGNVVCDEGMIMPDGTKLRRGKGFDYKDLYLGFYMDADVLSTDASGSFNVHTNDDDYMRYIECLTSKDVYPDGCPEVQGNQLRISMAIIGDYDGVSNSASGYSMEDDEVKGGGDFGVVAVQLLDSPYATEPVDLDQDGFNDIFPGEKLKMTDWHWFDWYNRPGVVSAESNNNCCAGEPGRHVALNKELIQYQLMAGDNTNLTSAEKTRYFHTANPQTDLDSELNPHFDSLEGLEQTSYFQNGAEGLDALLQMTTGPFDLDVGEQVNMSFVVLFGANIEDLKENAETAQILYNNHYSMPPSPSIPDAPELTASSETYSVTLSWDATAESSVDYFTNLPDFQGYRIYRSLDGGYTWGDTLYNVDGKVGWYPLVQFDLDDDISGTDPLAPWVNLGNNSGLQYTFTDTGLFAYNDHCYAITAYDSGLEPGDYDDQWYDFSDGFPSQESSINANKICLNLSTLEIYNPPTDVLFEAAELNIGISNIEYIVHNDEISGLFKFEIQADLDLGTYLSSPILNPELYVYEVNTLGNLISTISYQVTELSESELDSLLDMPGADLDSINDIIYLPDYIASELPIYPIDFEIDTFLDVLGMYVKIQNYNHYLPSGNDVPIKDIIYSDESLKERVNIMMRYKTNLTAFFQRPYFDYKIEFNTTPVDTAYRVLALSGCDHQIDENGDEFKTLLPFKFVNLTLDQDVLLWHYDKGIEEGLIQYGEVYSGSCDGCNQAQDEVCVFDQCIERTGYKNCSWERNEILHLTDIVYTTNDPDGDDEKFYELLIYPDVNKYFEYVGVDFSEIDTWNENDNYSAGEIVLHEGMLWELTEFATTSNHPDLWYDENGDYVNDNPWQMLYPWEDGDYIEIITPKMLHDGDSWLVDMSKIGDCTADLGNVNDDNNINILDVVRIINVVVGNAEFATNQNCTADINNDGMIDLLDSVALINIIMGYNDISLSGTGGSKQIDINVGLNLINIHSDEAFGGVQLDLEGDYSFTNIDFPSGWELYQGDRGIIAININRQGEKSDLILSYEGDLKIINHLASDLFGNLLASKVIGIPHKYSLNHPYPNPFNPTTTFSFAIPVDNEVTLTIYNLQGREVVSLINANMDAGYHSVVWNADSYSSGVYFVKMVAGEYVNTQKLMLVK